MKQIYRATIALFLCVCMALSLASCGKNLGVQVKGKTYTFQEYLDVENKDEETMASFENESVTVTGYVSAKKGNGKIRLNGGDEGGYPPEVWCTDIPEGDYNKMQLGDVVTVTGILKYYKNRGVYNESDYNISNCTVKSIN